MSVVPFASCPAASGCAVCSNFPRAGDVLRGRVVALVGEISDVLARPGLPAYSVRTLNRVDAAFGCLDALLRAGAPLPDAWTVAPLADSTLREEVTELYDVVSEALREVGDVSVCRQALRTASAGWRRLHGALCAGAPLPEPWQRP